VKQRLRSLLVAAALAALANTLWPYFTDVFPLKLWLLPHVLSAWVGALVFAAASLSVGLRLQGLLFPGPRRDGHVALAFATGGFAFMLGLTLLGHLHLFEPWLFWTYPAVLFLVGLEPLVEALQRWWQASRFTLTLAWWEWPFLLLGLAALAVAVLPTLAPMNLNFDARWYHLGIAERYVAAGGIERSEEGLMMLAAPHLASVLYTWGQLRPGVSLLDHTLLCQQLEVVTLLGTLFAVPPLVRALSPRLGVVSRWAWVTVLLFPSLYVYDTALMGGADHVAAWWVPTALLAWVQAQQRGDARSWALVAMHVGAIALTKYTAAFFIIPVVALVFVGFVVRLVRERSVAPLKVALVALATGLLVTSPLWLRNTLWYHNPLYPFAGALFPSTPWTEDSLAWAARFSADNGAMHHESFMAGVRATLTALWNYHLELYTWESFTKRLPIFGSLFTASVFVLPLIGRARRVWALVLVIHVGIALWFNLSHQLRYLIVMVPAMAAVAFVVFERAWRLGWAARAGVGLVVALQLSVTAGVPFLNTHAMNGARSAFAYTIDQFTQGLGSGNPQARLEPFNDWERVGRELPKKARILYHNRISMTGLQHVTLSDEPGVQYGLSYGRFPSMKAMHARLVEMGVSHLSWMDENGPPDSVAGELRFRAFAKEHVIDEPKGAWHYGQLAEPPAFERGDGVWFHGCGASYGTGLYRLADLTVPINYQKLPFPSPRVAGGGPDVQARAQYAVIETGCGGPTFTAPWEFLGKVEHQGGVRTFFVRRDAVIPFE